MLKCPICETALKTIPRHGVEIDFCTHCRGAWLDCRELDEIVERVRSEERITDQFSSEENRALKSFKNRDSYHQPKWWNDEPGRLDDGELPQDRYSYLNDDSHFGDELYYDSVLRRNRIWNE
jgi:Zn-finger nucleic acid-binding protein